MVHLLSALLWVASIGSLAHAGGVTTTTTISSTSTTVATSTTTLPSTTSTTVATSTTSSTSVSSTTSTSSTSTTSTTLVAVEACGNCRDDDGDGLTDFEDADCCETPPGTLALEQIHLRSDGETSRLKLTASSLPPIASLSPVTHTLFVQLAANDGEPGLCAAVDALHFRGKRSAATFTDRTNGVPSAGGITSIRLQRQGTDGVRLKLAGSHVAFDTPVTDHLRIAVALRALAEPGNPTRCMVRTVGVIGEQTNGLARP